MLSAAKLRCVPLYLHQFVVAAICLQKWGLYVRSALPFSPNSAREYVERCDHSGFVKSLIAKLFMVNFELKNHAFGNKKSTTYLYHN